MPPRSAQQLREALAASLPAPDRLPADRILTAVAQAGETLVERIDLRSLTAKVWEHRDAGGDPTGRYTWSGSVSALHYRDAGGGWQDIDVRLEMDDAGGGWARRMTRALYRIRLKDDGTRRIYPMRGDETKYIEIGGLPLGTPQRNSSPTLSWLEWDLARINVRVGIAGGQVGKRIILKDSQAPTQFSFSIAIVGLEVQREGWPWLLCDDGTRVVAEIHRPEARDAAGRDLPVSLVQEGQVVTIGVNVTGATFPIVLDPTVNLQVSASADDAVQSNDGTVNLTAMSPTLRDSGDSSDWRWFGARWTNVGVGRASIISSAVISLNLTGAPDDPHLDIHAQAADNAATFVATDNNISSRPKTTASITWNEIGAGSGFQSPASDAAGLVQEVVDRAGWASGGALAMIFDQGTEGAGNQVEVQTYDSGPANAPRLDITFTPPIAPTGIASVEAFGTAQLSLNVAAAGGIASAEAVGRPVLDVPWPTELVGADQPIAVMLYSSNLNSPTMLEYDLLERIVGTISFGTHIDAGFTACRFDIKANRAERTRWLRDRPLSRLVISDGATIYEGRLEDVVRTNTGLALGFMGYYSSCFDQYFRDQHGYFSPGSDEYSAAFVIQKIIEESCPSLQQEFEQLQDPGRLVSPYVFRGDELPGELFKKLGQAGSEGDRGEGWRPWHFQIWEDRIVWLGPRSRTSIDWRILESEAEMALGWSIDRLANRVKVEYMEKNTFGAYAIKETEWYTNPASFEKIGIWREGRASVGRGTLGLAEGVGRAIIDEHRAGMYAGQIIVHNRIRSGPGAWCPVWRVRAGQTLMIEDMDLDEAVLETDERLNRIVILSTQCEYDPVTSAATLSVTPLGGDYTFTGAVPSSAARFPTIYDWGGTDKIWWD